MVEYPISATTGKIGCRYCHRKCNNATATLIATGLEDQKIATAATRLGGQRLRVTAATSDEGSGPIKGCNLKSGWRIVADCIALQCILMAIDIGGDLAAVG